MSVLAYIKPICKDTDGAYEYDFFFSDTPEYVWGPFWDEANPSSLGDITPDQTTYSTVYRVKTDLPLKTFQETTCYSMEYTTYKIFPLAWIDIENLEEYPEFGRLAMYFGEEMEEIERKLASYQWKFRK